MRKYLFIFLMALMPLYIIADNGNIKPVFGKYGFTNYTSFDSLKQNIGKRVLYLPCTPLSYIEKNVFKTDKLIPGAEYSISNIKKDVRFNNLITISLISFQENNGNTTHKIKFSLEDAYQLPFLFIDDFNADMTNLIGKKFTDPLVKGAYTITDVKLESTNDGERYKEIIYYVNNPEINRNFKTTDYNSTIENFLKEDKSGSYHSTLVKVEKPENSSERYGDVITIDENGVTKYSFEDNVINIIILGGDKQFSFKLDNKTQNSIKIVWDDAVFVDIDGSTSKVMHSGIKYNEKETTQVATTLIGGASLDDIACPISNVRYDNVQKEWVTDTMYPNTISKGIKQFRLMLPIQIKEVVNEYVFVFNVEYLYNYPERLNL